MRKEKISALSLFFEFNSEQQILLLQLCRCMMMREHSKMRAVLGAATIFIKFYQSAQICHSITKENSIMLIVAGKYCMLYDLKQVVGAYGWSQIQAERSTREPLNSTRMCRPKDIYPINRYCEQYGISIYLTSNYHLSRIVRREHCTSKQHRRCLLLCNLNTPKNRLFIIANTLSIIFKVSGMRP